MATDPYALCPCGSGKKLKWCCGRFLPQLEKIVAQINNNQAESALHGLDKLAQESDVNHGFLACLRAQALFAFEKAEEAIQTIRKAIADFPDDGLPHEIHGDFRLVSGDIPGALDEFKAALDRYPPEATDQIVRALLRLGTCHNFQGRPLAAWAAWQRALKVKPGFEPAAEAIEQYIKDNHILPNAARHGLWLKSPDELAVFNEDRQSRWEAATARDRELRLEDLVTAFDYLAHDDTYDLAAWYNLALAHAWSGNNVKALEALDQYVKHENDFDAAANAWDLGEVLRLGAGAEAVSDIVTSVAFYAVRKPEEFLERIKRSRRILVMISPDRVHSFHWMSRDLEEPNSAVPLLGGPPRQLAQIHVHANGVDLVATRTEALREARRGFEELMGPTLQFVDEEERPGTLETLDAEPFLIAGSGKISDDERQQQQRAAVQQYFEDEWIHRPLRSLGGLRPINAAQSPEYRKKLEGIIRFRERNFARFDVSYSFDRLRNKLGLEGLAPARLGDDRPADISAYSVAQLAELVPTELIDEDLLTAYRAATALDAPRTAIHFGAEMIQRGSLAEKVDMISVFRRMIADRLETGQRIGVHDLLGMASTYDERYYQNSHRGELDALRARIHLAEGNVEAASEVYRRAFDEQKENLELIAGAVEKLLSAGAYPQAVEFAKLGMDRAQARRQREFQEQFREYLAEAGARA